MFKPEAYVDSVLDLLDDQQTLVAENIVKSPLDMQERYMSLVPDDLLDFIVKQWRPGMTSDQADKIFRKYSSFNQGGSVTTPKRGLVDEAGSYSGKKVSYPTRDYILKKLKQGYDIGEIVRDFAKENNIDIFGGTRENVPKARTNLNAAVRRKIYGGERMLPDKELVSLLENNIKNSNPDVVQKQFTNFVNKNKNKYLNKKGGTEKLYEDAVKWFKKNNPAGLLTYDGTQVRTLRPGQEVIRLKPGEGSIETSYKRGRQEIREVVSPSEGVGPVKSKNKYVRLDEAWKMAADSLNMSTKDYKNMLQNYITRPTQRIIPGLTGTKYAAGPEHVYGLRQAIGTSLKKELIKSATNVSPAPREFNSLIKGPLLDKKVTGMIDNAFNTNDIIKRKKIIKSANKEIELFAKKYPGIYPKYVVDKAGNIKDVNLKKINLKAKTVVDLGGEYIDYLLKTPGFTESKEYKRLPEESKNLINARKNGDVNEFKTLIKKIGCTEVAAGERVGFETGANCYLKGVEKINSGKIAKGAEARNFVKFANQAYKLGRNVLRFGVLPEMVWIGAETLIRVGMGEGLNESFKYATSYLPGGTARAKEADLSSLTKRVGLENAKTIMNVREANESKEKLNDLYNSRETDLAFAGAGGDWQAQADVEKRYKKRIEDAEKEYNIKSDFGRLDDISSGANIAARRLEDEAEDIKKSKSFTTRMRNLADEIRPDTFEGDIETVSPSESDLDIGKTETVPLFTMEDIAKDFIFDQYAKDPKEKLKILQRAREEDVNTGETDLERKLFEQQQGGIPTVNEIVWRDIFSKAAENPAYAEQLYGASGMMGEPIQNSIIRANQAFPKTYGTFASGGIASLTTTIPPKRGPNHQGLASLKKYGKQY